MTRNNEANVQGDAIVTTLDLRNLGSRGVAIDGPQAYAQIGDSIASAGDFNGDGIEDFVFTGPVSDQTNSGRGVTYLIFGKQGGIGSIDLTDLSPQQGFAIYGPVRPSSDSGVDTTAASAGDVNGDGFGDLIIGTPRNDTNGRFSGSSYVIYGHASNFATLDLATMTAAQGSRIDISPYFQGPSIYGGTNWGPFLGESVANAGDVNNDGFADVVVGAPFHSTDGAPQAGAAFLLFGSASGIGTINVATMTASQGYALLGTEGGGTAGRDVAGLGDVNGDGIDDFAVSIPTYSSGAGKVVVRFGIDGGSFSGGLTPSTAQGFVIRGPEFTGYSIAGAGDINGDGYQDILVAQYGGNSTTAFLLWGKASFSDIDLTALNAADGIRIDRSAAEGTIGDVAGAGDVNGDGFDDFTVGIYDSWGYVLSAEYLIYGSATLNSITLGTTDGWVLRTGDLTDRAGRSLGSADVNGDGFTDLLVGTRGGNVAAGYLGASYVVYGDVPTGSVARTGTAASQTLAGGDLDDTLDGLGGDDELYGNGGHDTLYGGTGNDTLKGGLGTDTMTGADGDDVYFVDLGDLVVEGAGGGNDTLIVLTDYALAAAAQIERIETVDAAATTLLNVVANDFAQTMVGNAGANGYSGGGGNDTLLGLGGNDTLRGDAGNDDVQGDNGDDLLTGGSGADWLTGGAGSDVFADGVAGLNGDTITDLAIGEKIRVTDAVLAGFTLTLSGSVVTYTGGTLTLLNLPGNPHLQASAAAGGGVELTLGLNALPDAVNDSAVNRLGTALVIAVRANDTDANADALSITAVGAPAHGTAMANPDGTITYTPNEDYRGADSFTYTASDGQGGTDTATVAVAAAPLAQTILTPGQSYAMLGFPGLPTDVFVTGTAAGAEVLTIGDYTGAGFSNNFATGGDTIRLTGSAADFQIGVSGNQVSLASAADHIAVQLPVGFAAITIAFETAPGVFADSRTLRFMPDGADTDTLPDLFLGSQRFMPDVAPVAVLAFA